MENSFNKTIKEIYEILKIDNYKDFEVQKIYSTASIDTVVLNKPWSEFYLVANDEKEAIIEKKYDNRVNYTYEVNLALENRQILSRAKKNVITYNDNNKAFGIYDLVKKEFKIKEDNQTDDITEIDGSDKRFIIHNKEKNAFGLVEFNERLGEIRIPEKYAKIVPISMKPDFQIYKTTGFDGKSGLYCFIRKFEHDLNLEEDKSYCTEYMDVIDIPTLFDDFGKFLFKRNNTFINEKEEIENIDELYIEIVNKNKKGLLNIQERRIEIPMIFDRIYYPRNTYEMINPSVGYEAWPSLSYGMINNEKAIAYKGRVFKLGELDINDYETELSHLLEGSIIKNTSINTDTHINDIAIRDFILEGNNQYVDDSEKSRQYKKTRVKSKSSSDDFPF